MGKSKKGGRFEKMLEAKAAKGKGKEEMPDAKLGGKGKKKHSRGKKRG